jgi:hypothetical protein
MSISLKNGINLSYPSASLLSPGSAIKETSIRLTEQLHTTQSNGSRGELEVDASLFRFDIRFEN